MALLVWWIIACPHGCNGSCVHVPQVSSGCHESAAVRTCLAGKRVAILGNSVSRHWAYTLVHVLQGMNKALRLNPRGWFDSEEIIAELAQMPDRQSEKTDCASGAGKGAKHCSWELNNGTESQITIIFQWFDTLSDKQIVNAVENSEADVLIINSGTNDIFLAGMMKEPDPEQRYERWHNKLVEQKGQLAAVLNQLSVDGKRIYWRTSTPFCGCGGSWIPNPYWPRRDHKEDLEGLQTMNSAVRQSNDELVASICGNKTTTGGIRILNSYDWVMDYKPTDPEGPRQTDTTSSKKGPARPTTPFPACDHYDDAVHLSFFQFGHVNNWLCDLCGASEETRPHRDDDAAAADGT